MMMLMIKRAFYIEIKNFLQTIALCIFSPAIVDTESSKEHPISTLYKFKGGINLNAIFPPLDMALMEISRSRFKQSKNSMLIP